MIELKNLSYYYGKSTVAALDNVSARIGTGVHLMLGENGAGKTTMLKCVAGLLLPTGGECLVDGVSVTKRLPSELARVFYLGVDEGAFMHDIDSMVRRHAPFYPRFDAEELKRNLDAFGLSSSQKLSSMSLGMRHKAMLAYALSLNTEVLLLDEPANGLDIESKMALLRMIAGKCDDEHTVLVATHTISDMETLYDGLIVMQANHIRLTAMTEEIAERFAFVRTLSKVDDSLYSEWRGGKMCSILPVDKAEELGLESGPVDYAVLYGALHSPAAPEVIKYMTAPCRSDYKPFSNGVDYE